MATALFQQFGILSALDCGDQYAVAVIAGIAVGLIIGIGLCVAWRVMKGKK